jgi:hypothetical protein
MVDLDTKQQVNINYVTDPTLGEDDMILPSTLSLKVKDNSQKSRLIKHIHNKRHEVITK